MFLQNKQSTNSNNDSQINFTNNLDRSFLPPLDMAMIRQDSYQFSKLADKSPDFNPFDNFMQNGLVDQEHYEEFIDENGHSETIHYDCPANGEIKVELDAHDKQMQSELSQLIPTENSQANSKEADVTGKSSDYEASEEESDEYEPEKKRKGSKIISKKVISTGVTKKIRKINKKKNCKKPKEDTKNLLRNFGNAQNKFAKDHAYSEALINSKFEHMSPKDKVKKIQDFRKWIPTKLENFKQFQDVWSKTGEYADLYREICWDFYEKFAAHYIYSASRMSEENTRKTHQKYVYRFLEGIIDPSKFFFFKSTKG